MPFRVVVKRTQLIKLARERSLGRTITMSAIKAGMSRNTAREDPLAAVWPRAEAMLRQAPELGRRLSSNIWHRMSGRKSGFIPACCAPSSEG